ncbi:distal long tail fiber assembly catalyst [Yersinia phage vB_YenM_TG1]|uniref:Distal long tail fiber assembly catalyst n=1 Tax=Yersinia phage vB_YenM_TG1 TaxID=1589265 RepID=A0A0B4ZZ77_9CAUD|nr:tail fiber adhesin [Yersinia phage vB_YenM_TG1]AJD81843.1 distal long tail fiber assembly catalyst [Yersinia phage vB_YenM_TG1]
MAVTGPWVGSSAKAETGQAWMAAAGAELRMTAPFYEII